jgi:Zn-dependent protease with chaperone function
MVWWGLGVFLIAPLATGFSYVLVRFAFGVTSSTALLFVGVAVPMLIAVGLGWQIGAAVNRYDEYKLGREEVSTSTESSMDEDQAAAEEYEASESFRWLSWIPEQLNNFFVLFLGGSIVSGGFITLVWVFFVRLTPEYPMPSPSIVVGGLFPMLILASYFGCLAVTGAPFVSMFWRETTSRLETPEARHDHALRVTLVLGGFFVLLMAPWEVLPIPANFRMPVTWALAFTYLFFVLTLMPFLNMARPLTPEEYAAIVPEEIDTDPHTTVWVATVGFRSTAIATGVWPFRQIFVGENLLEDDSISAESLRAILYHEHGHHVLGHLRLAAGAGLIFFGGVGGMLAVVSSSMQTLGVVMGILAFGFRFGLVRWIRRAELAADEYERQHVGSETAITALQSVADLRSKGNTEKTEASSLPWGAPFVIEWFLRVHPSVEDRVAVLRERQDQDSSR